MEIQKRKVKENMVGIKGTEALCLFAKNKTGDFQKICDNNRERKNNMMLNLKGELMRRFPKMDEDFLLDKMILHDFPLQDEKWTDWAPVEHSGSQCSKLLARTCLTDNCLGPASKCGDKKHKDLLLCKPFP